MPVQINIGAFELGRLILKVRHIKEGVPKVLAPAINRTLDSGRTVVKREIRKIYLIKAKDIPTKVVGARPTKLRGQLVLKQGMLELNKFKVVPKGVQKLRKKRTIFAQVKKGGGGYLPGAFIPANVGYVGPFIRKKGVGRLPITKLKTIGAPIMASQPTVGPAVNKAMGDTLAKRMDHEIRRIMAKQP